MRKHLIGLLWDLGLPLVVYYAGRILGYDVLPALAAAAGAALLRVAFIAVVRRRLNGLAAFVGGTFALLLVVSLLTGDPRILLAKESVLSGAAGLLLVGSMLCSAGRSSTRSPERPTPPSRNCSPNGMSAGTPSPRSASTSPC